MICYKEVNKKFEIFLTLLSCKCQTKIHKNVELLFSEKNSQETSDEQDCEDEEDDEDSDYDDEDDDDEEDDIETQF